jgi:hypothetical protein
MANHLMNFSQLLSQRLGCSLIQFCNQQRRTAQKQTHHLVLISNQHYFINNVVILARTLHIID